MATHWPLNSKGQLMRVTHLTNQNHAPREKKNNRHSAVGEGSYTCKFCSYSPLNSILLKFQRAIILLLFQLVSEISSLTKYCEKNASCRQSWCGKAQRAHYNCKKWFVRAIVLQISELTPQTKLFAKSASNWACDLLIHAQTFVFRRSSLTGIFETNTHQVDYFNYNRHCRQNLFP